MKRRRALQNIVVATAGISMIPSCAVDTTPIFSNIPLAKEQYQLLRGIISAIVPPTDPELNTPESPVDFVLTMINDCYSPKEIKKYISGFNLFQQYILDEYKVPFDQLNSNQHILLFTEISNSEIFPKNLKYFVSGTKYLAVRHFNSSETFMKEKLNFEFAPARYIGCVAR